MNSPLMLYGRSAGLVRGPPLAGSAGASSGCPARWLLVAFSLAPFRSSSAPPGLETYLPGLNARSHPSRLRWGVLLISRKPSYPGALPGFPVSKAGSGLRFQLSPGVPSGSFPGSPPFRAVSEGSERPLNARLWAPCPGPSGLDLPHCVLFPFRSCAACRPPGGHDAIAFGRLGRPLPGVWLSHAGRARKCNGQG